MRNILRNILYFSCTLALCMAFAGCSENDTNDGGSGLEGSGITNLNNPKEGQDISYFGETVTISFTASAAWSAEVVTSDGGSWVRISAQNNNTAAGDGSVRLVFEKNTNAPRTAELYVTVEGHKRSLLCTMTQPNNNTDGMSTYLNEKMHERLLTDYLWNGDYKKLSDEGKIDFDVAYGDFLFQNLTKMGETNIEDGGYYRDFSSLRGQRFIYSYIQETTQSSASASSAPQTRATSYRGLGMGPSLAMGYTSQDTRCLILGYVYIDSPADKAGLRRGDLIVGVNGKRLDRSNYSAYQYELYTSTSGKYDITYARYKADGKTLVEYDTSVTAGTFTYNPVLVAAQFTNTEKTVNIGYLVLESFDISSQEALSYQLKVFKDLGISDMILDLRFNPGGSVASCRYLMSSIVGSAHYDDTFAKMTFNDGTEEIWSFGYGNPLASDGLGQGPDLGLDRLYVITSENTGSAAEIVINSLKGIDFPVYTYGSRTAGKNVGMVTSYLTHSGRRFEFAPITFYVKNAKGFGDYADGFEVDHSVNNQNASYDDDLDRYFPYCTTDWGNSAADPALLWAMMNATTGEDPDFTPKTSAAKFNANLSNTMQPVPNTPIELKLGRYGNVIYGTTEDAR